MKKAFQERLFRWEEQTFGGVIFLDKTERSCCFFEEAVELIQACGFPKERALLILDHVYSKEPGQPNEEIADVVVGLTLLAMRYDVDLQEAADNKLVEIESKIDIIRAKRLAKPDFLRNVPNG